MSFEVQRSTKVYKEASKSRKETVLHLFMDPCKLPHISIDLGSIFPLVPRISMNLHSCVASVFSLDFISLVFQNGSTSNFFHLTVIHILSCKENNTLDEEYFDEWIDIKTFGWNRKVLNEQKILIDFYVLGATTTTQTTTTTTSATSEKIKGILCTVGKVFFSHHSISSSVPWQTTCYCFTV